MHQTIDAADRLAAQYREDGFCVAAAALAADEIAALIDEAMRLCREEAAKLTDGDAAAGAEDDMGRFLAIHFPHKLSALMRETLAHRRILDVLTRVIGPNVKCMQSMLFIKNAGKPGQAWHQDEDFIPTRDRSLGAAWIALDDATVDNGCLWVIPGSQRPGILWPLRQHRNPEYDFAPESSTSRIATRMRSPSRSAPAASSSSTATCSTSRSRTAAPAVSAGPWSTTI